MPDSTPGPEDFHAKLLADTILADGPESADELETNAPPSASVRLSARARVRKPHTRGHVWTRRRSRPVLPWTAFSWGGPQGCQ